MDVQVRHIGCAGIAKRTHRLALADKLTGRDPQTALAEMPEQNVELPATDEYVVARLAVGLVKSTEPPSGSPSCVRITRPAQGASTVVVPLAIRPQRSIAVISTPWLCLQ